MTKVLESLQRTSRLDKTAEEWIPQSKIQGGKNMRINNNIAALNTLRQYSSNTAATNKSMEKLSSGSRINRAGDDAAGLAISEKMRAQIRGINMAADNSQNAISLVQTAEGALTETHSILQRMNELAVQSASDTNETIDRNALNAEFQELVKEIDDIASQTKFNNKTLLDGSVGVAIDTANSTLDEIAGVASMTASGASMTYTFANTATSLTIDNGLGDSVTLAAPAAGDTIRVAQWGIEVKLTSGFAAESLNGKIVTGASSGLTIQTGATNGEKLTIDINSMKAADLGISGATKIDTQADAETAIDTVATAINTVSTQRANLGAYQNRLEHKINNLSTSSENLQAAESRIRDIDMAKEMVNFTKNNILLQAAQSMLAQANAQPQGVLQLLQ